MLQSAFIAKAGRSEVKALRAQIKDLQAEKKELQTDIRELCDQANATPAGKDACYAKYTATKSK